MRNASTMQAIWDIMKSTEWDVEEQEQLEDFLNYLLFKRKRGKPMNGHIKELTAVELQKIADNYAPDSKWTYSFLQKVFSFTYKAKVEILRNSLYIMPTPTARHQEIVKDLSFAIERFTRKHKMGKLYFAPLDVILDENNVVQPDILFIKSGRQLINKKGFVQGAPDLVVEVMSPANYKKARLEKMGIYQEFEVQEYWEIFPETFSCTVYTLTEGTYIEFSKAEQDGVVTSSILEGLEIDLKDFLTPNAY